MHINPHILKQLADDRVADVRREASPRASQSRTPRLALRVPGVFRRRQSARAARTANR